MRFLRGGLTYQFQEVASDSAFLTMAVYREFRGDTDEVLRGTSYIFTREGSVNITRESYDPYLLETSSTTMDVSSLYSGMPEFGDYTDLIRLERLNARQADGTL